MRTGRKPDELRPVQHHAGGGQARRRLGAHRARRHARASARPRSSDGVPGWLRGSGRGWLTAEYSMLPGGHAHAHAARGRARQAERAHAWRSSASSAAACAPSSTSASSASAPSYVDCDVLQADGGTRTASITRRLRGRVPGRAASCEDRCGLHELPLFDSVAAVSVGVVDGERAARPGLRGGLGRRGRHERRSSTGDGRLVEVQATAEGEPYSRAALDAMLDLAAAGAAAAGGRAGGGHARSWRRPSHALRARHRQPPQAAEFGAILAPCRVVRHARPASTLPPEGVESFAENARGKARGAGAGAAATRAARGARPAPGRAGALPRRRLRVSRSRRWGGRRA